MLANVLYLLWRAGYTLPADALWLAVPMLLLELHAALGLVLFVHSAWNVNPPLTPSRAADAPTVAVLITTCNEQLEVLLPTVAAAIAMEGEHETWVLDDGNRIEVAQMARGLGARYVTRPDREHAKAGNLNHALGLVTAEFIAVLDADHVPERHFLTRTLGYFTDSSVAVVQTPQDFYNVDSFEHFAGRSPHEESLFYRVIQAGKHNAGAAFWCGTNAVLRVEALRSVGGVATDTLTEDLHTTLRLHRGRWRTVYHNEVLARGLAAAGTDQFLAQRLRWGRGAMQVLRLDNPLRGPGLNWRQRVAYAYSLSAWFDSWRTLGLALIPVAVLATGTLPIAAHPLVFLIAAGGTFALQQTVIVLLSRGHSGLLMAWIFDYIRLPVNLRATVTVLRPRRPAFQVTAKGRTGSRRSRARTPLPLLLLVLVLLVTGVWAALSWAGFTPTTYAHGPATWFAAAWLAVSLGFALAAMARFRRVEFGVERRNGYRFHTGLFGRVNGIDGPVTDVSLSGAQLHIPGHRFAVAVGDTVELSVLAGPWDSGVTLSAVVRGSSDAALRLEFLAGQWAELATLARMLFGAELDHNFEASAGRPALSGASATGVA